MLNMYAAPTTYEPVETEASTPLCWKQFVDTLALLKTFQSPSMRPILVVHEKASVAHVEYVVLPLKYASRAPS